MILIYGTVLYGITLCILWFCQKGIWGIFTSDPQMEQEREWYYYGFFIMCALDFWQVIFNGSFKALGKMDIFNKFNFVTYFLIIIPLSIVLCFYVGEYNGYIDHDGHHTIKKQKGLG